MSSNNTLRKALLAVMLVAAVVSYGVAEEKDEDTTMLFDFKKAEVAKAWRTVNDGVMGGVSDGSVRITKEKTLEFFGKLSLENNGGFTSVRSQSGKFDMSECDALVCKLRGDGRTYNVNVYVPAERFSISYRTQITTKKGEWQEVRVPFDDFRATWRGRDVRDAPPLDLSKVQSVGFLLSDKKAGPFKLELAWIKGAIKQDD